mgnify:CR=1 FL=1
MVMPFSPCYGIRIYLWIPNVYRMNFICVSSFFIFSLSRVFSCRFFLILLCYIFLHAIVFIVFFLFFFIIFFLHVMVFLIVFLRVIVFT